MTDKPKFHLARLDTTRLDTFDFVEPVERVETSVSSESRRAVPTWRTTSYSARLYKFSRFYALAYTNPICFVK